MSVKQIKIPPDRVVWAEAKKADRLVKEGRAEYVDVPSARAKKAEPKKVK